MSKFIGRVCVGFLASLPITCFLAGGVQNGIQFLVLSIVCTAGIALVAWIPLWWVVGWGTLAVLALIGDKISQVDNNPVSSPTPTPSRGDLALKAYISHATATGMDADLMVRRLYLNGWTMTDIQCARENLISSSSKAQRI